MDILWEVFRRKTIATDEHRPEPIPPWRSGSVGIAGLTSVAGLVTWLNGHSPALMAFGSSYIGGYLIGWVFRRFVKTAALITSGCLLLIGGLKGTGWIELDWAAIEYALNEGLTVFQDGAESTRQLLTGYLPSAGSGIAGVFFGFRKKIKRVSVD